MSESPSIDCFTIVRFLYKKCKTIYVLFVKCAYKHALDLHDLDKWRCQKVNLTELFINCRPAAKRPQNFIFEPLQRILRSIDFKDVIEASKHGVNK